METMLQDRPPIYFLTILRQGRFILERSSAASHVYKRQMEANGKILMVTAMVTMLTDQELTSCLINTATSIREKGVVLELTVTGLKVMELCGPLTLAT